MKFYRKLNGRFLAALLAAAALSLTACASEAASAESGGTDPRQEARGTETAQETAPDADAAQETVPAAARADAAQAAGPVTARRTDAAQTAGPVTARHADAAQTTGDIAARSTEMLPEEDGAVLLSSSSHTVPTSYTPSSNAYDGLAVANVTDALNLRAEPSTDSEVLGTCYRGGGGRILEQRDGWTKIRSGSLEGWLKNDYLVFGQDIRPIASELGLFAARIATQTLNVRETPSTDAAIVGQVAKDEYYPVLKEEDEWALIQLSADTAGYISLDYAQIEIIPGEVVSIEAIEAELAALEEAEEAASGPSGSSSSKPAAPSYLIPASEEDIYLMASCLMMEANGTYEGQLAVGNVIVNRVQSGHWGDSISDVIYAAGQFPGATSGLLDKYLAQGPSSSALKATKDALSGVNQIGDYLYFTSSKSANRAAYSDYIEVGGNCFYKR